MTVDADVRPAGQIGVAAAASGVGRVELRRVGARTVVARAYTTSPLRLLTPLNHGGGAWVYVASYGGGLVDGDALRLSIDVGPDAVGLLATQASTKVYRSPTGTSMTLQVHLQPGSTLVVAPDPVVCFAGATYEQTQRFELDTGANLVLVDWLTSGRRAAGERWAFDAYRARTSIRRAGRSIVEDALSLRAADGGLSARLGRFDVLAAVTLVGPGLRDDAADLAGRVAQRPIERRADLLVSASRLGDDGVIVRLASVSVERVAQKIREFLTFVPALLGDDPWTRRP